MTELEKLLEPIAGDNPCGQDLWLVEGRFLLQQPLEQAWRNGEQPKWEDVRDAAFEQLKRSRDLRTTIVLCLALFRTDGLFGFRDGVKLIRETVERFWDKVYPIPETPNDQTRSNTLSNLSAPLGSDTPYQFVKYLRESALCKSAAGTAYSLADIERAEAGKAPAQDEEDKPSATSDQIQAAFRSAPKDKLRENYELVSGTLSQIEAIEGIVASKAGSGYSVDFKALKETLTKMGDALQPYVDEAVARPKTGGEIRPGQGAGGPSVPGGGIRSRSDADAALAAVCDYLQRNEPTSPVPLILERARRLLKMGFMDSMRDLAPDTVEKFNSLFGIREPEKKEGGSDS